MLDPKLEAPAKATETLAITVTSESIKDLIDEQRKLQAAEAERLKKLAEQTARPAEDIPVVPVRASSVASPVDRFGSDQDRLLLVADLIDQVEIPTVCDELHDVRRTISRIVEKAVVDIYAAVRTARK